MKHALLFMGFLIAPMALAAEPIDVRCAKQAEESNLVYPDIFSIVVDIKEISSRSFNQVMSLVSEKTLKVIEWDLREENEIRAFVTWPNGLATPEAKSSLQKIGEFEGVSTLCVSRTIRF